MALAYYDDQDNSGANLPTIAEGSSKLFAICLGVLSIAIAMMFLTYSINDELNNHQIDQSNNVDIRSFSGIQDDTKQLKRRFFLFPSRRRKHRRYRPKYFYGRKSHWDTFFGKK